MKNYILSIALVLSISACKQNKSVTTTTTTETTQTKPTDTLTTTPQMEPSVAPIEPSTTESESNSEPSNSKTKPTSTSSKPKSTTKSQTTAKTTPTNSGDEIVKKALYTPKERESTRKNFIKDVDQIDMSPEIRAQYTAIIQKHWSRIRTANNDRKLTKDQATDYVNRVIREQNSEVKRILTVKQYNEHIQIMNRYQNSVLYRIERQ